MISVQDLSKTYGSVVAAAGLSFVIAPGEIVGSFVHHYRPT